MKKNPKISVIIPVFNGEKYIKRAVESVLMQTYGNLELIVIDDMSADRSREILRQLNADRVFTYIENKTNLGLSKNLNKAISYANNPDFLFILQNDCILKTDDYIEKAVGIFNEDESIGALTGKPEIEDFNSISFTDKLNILLYLSDVKSGEKGIHEINFIEGRADMYRFDVLREIGFFDESLTMSGEDQIMSMRIRGLGYKIIQNCSLNYYISYGGNQDTYFKVLFHLFKMAKGLPYVIRHFGFRSAENKLLTDNRKMRKSLRFSQCMTLFFTASILAVSFADIRFLWFFTALFGWRLLYYSKIIYPQIRFSFTEKLIYLITGILSDYFYSSGFVYGGMRLFLSKRI